MNIHDDLPRHLAQAYPDTLDELRGLRERLAAAAQAEGILDIAYRTVDSPVGPLLLAATDVGLVRVAYPREDHDTVLQNLADRISPRILHAPARRCGGERSASTSPVSARDSTCRSTGASRAGSAAWS